MLDEGKIAAFEAGIKLGALFHQFVGMPVSMSTKKSAEHAIEQSVKNQPYVEDVLVRIDEEKLRKACNNPFGYASLSGEMLYARVKIRYGNAIVVAELKYSEDKKYPEMRLVEEEE